MLLFIVLFVVFQSTRPVRGGTAPTISHTARFTFQSTRPVRGGTRNTSGLRNQSKISIHPPRAGRDEKKRYYQLQGNQFQSTRPVRGGTAQSSHTFLPIPKISIHPPRAGRDDHQAPPFRFFLISIHPPRAGRDPSGNKYSMMKCHFNPPAPCGAGPVSVLVVSLRPQHFNPPAPCGAGLSRCAGCANSPISIHPPRAGRDSYFRDVVVYCDISIHPPRAGRDKAVCEQIFR